MLPLSSVLGVPSTVLRQHNLFEPLFASRAAAETSAVLEHFRTSLQLPSTDLSSEVRALILCVHRHLFSPGLSVKTVKERCALRDHNSSSRFKSETGVYLSSYISSLRVQAAVRLLRRPGMSATEVARRVGFANVQTFYRVFRVVLGCTPGVFRKGPT